MSIESRTILRACTDKESDVKRRPRTNGFTLIELLVVVAIIALLISILLPSLQKAREQGKLTKCLANMRGIGQASLNYASEDSREHIVPIHQSNTAEQRDVMRGLGPWGLRTARPFSFGGKTPTTPFVITGTQSSTVMMDDDGFWGAKTRPLNKYAYSGVFGPAMYKDLPWFQCPSDKGYPNSPWVQDAPLAANGISCYDMLGNSYRVNIAGLRWLNGAGNMSVAAWGHRSSSLPNTSRLAMYSEPMFYNFSRQSGAVNPDLLPVRGWHRKLMTDNVTYADGSARPTTVNELAEFDPQTLAKMGFTGNQGWRFFLRRGTTWQTDCYPTGGAYIPRFRNSTGVRISNRPPGGFTGWPYYNYQDNFGRNKWE